MLEEILGGMGVDPGRELDKVFVHNYDGMTLEKNITNHSFRHYVVTAILDNTANVEVVKAVTGHRDTKTIFEH